MRVLLTGFGPFPGVEKNASAELVKRLAEAAADRFEGHSFSAAVLPTEWDKGPQLMRALVDDVEPELILLFGVSEKSSGMTLETLARNVCGPKQDACGAFSPGGNVLPGGPETIAASLPFDEIARRLDGLGVPHEFSQDAGAYLCNALFYACAVNYCGDDEDSARVGFVHVPSNLTEADAEMSMAQAVTGGLGLLEVCLGEAD